MTDKTKDILNIALDFACVDVAGAMDEYDNLKSENDLLKERLGRIAELTFDADFESADLIDVPAYIKQIRDIATEGE